MNKYLTIIGAGLAGSEAAWQAANAGVKVTLYEMRPVKKTHAHTSEDCAELVCSNSFRSDDATRSAIGVLHEEMRQADSLIIRCGDAHKVPAGGALAVDREGFAAAVTHALENHPNITLKREEITRLPSTDTGEVIVASGPLTSESLTDDILKLTGEEYLAFFDYLLKGHSSSKIQKKFTLENHRVEKILAKLEKLDLIEWLPKNRRRFQ